MSLAAEHSRKVVARHVIYIDPHLGIGRRVRLKLDCGHFITRLRGVMVGRRANCDVCCGPYPFRATFGW